MQLSAKDRRTHLLFAYSAALIRLDAVAFNSPFKIAALVDLATRGSRAVLERHHLFRRAYLDESSLSDLKQINPIAHFAAVIGKQSPRDHEPALDTALYPPSATRCTSGTHCLRFGGSCRTTASSSSARPAWNASSRPPGKTCRARPSLSPPAISWETAIRNGAVGALCPLSLRGSGQPTSAQRECCVPSGVVGQRAMFRGCGQEMRRLTRR